MQLISTYIVLSFIALCILYLCSIIFIGLLHEYCPKQYIILHELASAISYIARDNIYIIMWSCPGNMPNYYPGLRDVLPDRRGG